VLPLKAQPLIIQSISVRNFRSIDRLDIDLERLTVLLGANSAGKSTVIRALEWFFDGERFDLDDVRDQNPELVVSVRVTFTGFADADRQAFPGYTTGEKMTLLKTRNSDGSVKLTGRGLVYPAFKEIRSQEGAVAVRMAFNAFRDAHPEFDLERATSQAQALARMEAWEREHPELCEEDERDASHLLGAVGQGVLRQRFKFVFVPALRDAALDAQEGRNTTLSQLLSAIAEQRAAAGERVADLEREVRERYEEIVVDAHGASLEELSAAMTEQLRSLISNAEVRLEAQPAALTLPGPRVLLRAGEAGSLTDISRQGHGFQRTFIITALRYLSESDVEGADAPAIFLAIEEPELYQHPARARHFSTVLERLADRGEPPVQVLYATHSPYFVNAGRFASLRLFRRALGEEGRLSPPSVLRASAADVAAKLAGVVDPAHIERRLSRTIDDNHLFSEAFFGQAVILTEGFHDARVLQEVARMDGASLEADGIVVVHASKTALPIAFTILSLLGIPAYVVFDGDNNCHDDQLEMHRKLNRDLQTLMGVQEPEDFPSSGARENWAAFEETLEATLRLEIPDFDSKCQRTSEKSDWRVKSGETYVAVIRDDGAAPALLTQIVAGARRLAV
jgi:putative ATP-dependent endonuclease of OLD family